MLYFNSCVKAADQLHFPKRGTNTLEEFWTTEDRLKRSPDNESTQHPCSDKEHSQTGTEYVRQLRNSFIKAARISQAIRKFYAIRTAPVVLMLIIRPCWFCKGTVRPIQRCSVHKSCSLETEEMKT